jgi:hypothetical protein
MADERGAPRGAPEPAGAGGPGAEAAAPPPPTGDTPVTLRWDGTNLRSAYANACNVMSSQDEVVMLFGLNQTWAPGAKDVTVKLSNRVILNPVAAKRVLEVLTNVVREHEARFGTIRI